MTKDPKKLLLTLMIIAIFIALVAFAVGICPQPERIHHCRRYVHRGRLASRKLLQMEKTFIKTGIFGGTFNPVHIGHLALANYLCEYEDLDEVWFLVTPQNPFKKDVRLLDDRIRLEMVEAATRGYPRFRASVIPVSGLPTSSSVCLALLTPSIHFGNFPKLIPNGSLR